MACSKSQLHWALAGLQRGHIAHYTLVYPDWLGKVEIEHRYPRLKEFHDRISVQTWSEWQNTDEIDDLEAAFFCRSSSWCPPWLDPGFQTLLDEWGDSECLDCRYGQMCTPHDACEPRAWVWDDVWKLVDERQQNIGLLTGRMKVE